MKGDTEILVITGMSGAGRSTVAHTLEDLGWYVVDNLPPALLGNYEVTDGRRPVNRQQSSATSVPPLPPPPAAPPADQAPIMIADGNLLHANVNDTHPGVNDGATNADESAYADESERGAVDAPESSASDDESSDDEDANEEDSDEEQEAEAEER